MVVENGFLRRFIFTFCPISEAFKWLLINADFFMFLANSQYVPTLWYQNIKHICSLVGMRVDQKYFFDNYALVRSGRRKDIRSINNLYYFMGICLS